LTTPARHGRGAARIALALGAALACAVFVALGVWQVERRAWKLALIERVNARVHAPAVAAPAPAEWPQVAAATHEYRHVAVSGTFRHDLETRVQAVTELGAGYWVLTPLQAADGAVVLVNRGFVPPEQRDRTSRSTSEATGPVSVAGLLRLTEPGGGFLRHNDAAADRWHSRDVAAIAAARGLGRVAPYFIDADRGDTTGPGPVGGLTVIAFRNHHAVYALTWFALALMAAGAAVYTLRTRDHPQDDAPHP
jgi:surfeit locus 1 family protein